MEDKFLSVAKQAALEAGKVSMSYYGKKHQYNFKNQDKSDFATQADLEAEELIIRILTENFPGHNIIAEETGRKKKDSEYTWVIDPLDGTFSFSIGMPYFAVSIGLMKDNQPILGVIYQPVQDDLYLASLGKGVDVNGKTIHISQKDDLSSSSMVVDFGHKARRGPKIDSYIVPLCKEAGHIYSIGTTAMAMALAARGIQEGMIAQAWIWDFAAGAVIVKEAGGKVTDFKGQVIDWTKDRLNVLATNGLIHEAVLEAINGNSKRKA